MKNTIRNILQCIIQLLNQSWPQFSNLNYVVVTILWRQMTHLLQVEEW
jgi:hypothetical protein